MNIRLTSAATVVLAAGVLAASTPTLSQAAGGSAIRSEDRHSAAPTARDAQSRAAITPCKGGVQKKAYSGGHSGWFGTNGSDVVPGANYRFKGPSSRKDAVFVSLTAFDTYTDSGSYGRARVLLDGVEMAPADTAGEYFYNSNNNEALAGQYCGRVGSGWHRVKVVLDSFGGDYSYLYNPMVHVEVAN